MYDKRNKLSSEVEVEAKTILKIKYITSVPEMLDCPKYYRFSSDL